MSIEGVFWRRAYSPIYRLLKNSKSVNFQYGLIAYGLPVIDVHEGGRLIVGERAVLCSKSKFTALGVSKPVVIRVMEHDAVIVIGSDVGLSGTVICASKAVTIGKECLFGADVMVCDTDFHPIEPKGRRYSRQNVRSAPVTIGDNVFIGARSIILKGVTIGEQSVIGAGSVVSSDIPPNVVAAGNPCKVLRQLPSLGVPR